MARRLTIGGLVMALAACGTAPDVRPPADVRREVSAAPTVPERALRDRVAALLAERMGDAARGLRVHVVGTNLWLTGRAPDRWERDRAHDLAHEVAGVTRVDSSGVVLD